jgi:hypothetical protein
MSGRGGPAGGGGGGGRARGAAARGRGACARYRTLRLVLDRDPLYLDRLDPLGRGAALGLGGPPLVLEPLARLRVPSAGVGRGLRGADAHNHPPEGLAQLADRPRLLLVEGR